jgi:large subunit ribosomal protein L6
MSRIGKQPVRIPSGVDVDVADGNVVTVKGPRGSLTQTMHPDMRLVVDDGVLSVERPDDEGFHRSLHGLTRSLVANMVEGVTKGFEKRLQIVGVGYRAAMKGQDLEIAAGYSHPVVVPQPDGIEFEVPTPNIRKIRKPEPYKGKGIRYEGEYVRKKAGKAAKTGAA